LNRYGATHDNRCRVTAEGTESPCLSVLEDGVYHVDPVAVALVGHVDERDLQGDDVLWWHLWPRPAGQLVKFSKPAQPFRYVWETI
jgi:hypothetical protein